MICSMQTSPIQGHQATFDAVIRHCTLPVVIDMNCVESITIRPEKHDNLPVYEAQCCCVYQ